MAGNKDIITQFYSAFANHDAETMVSLYHDEIEFTDPAFGTLKGDDVKNMWRMLIERGKSSLVITFDNVQAHDSNASATWTADYLFSSTGKMVHNVISAQFELKDGKIFRHTDTFSFWKWSRQALGIPGLFLGWTPFLQKKVQQQARKGLSKFSAGKN